MRHQAKYFDCNSITERFWPLNKDKTSSLLAFCTFLARAGGVPVGRRLRGRLATRLVASINVIIFSPSIFYHFFFSVATFSHSRSAQIKKLI